MIDKSRVPATPATAAEPSPASVKIVVAGGFGVGKTTFVGAVSEITPVTTEASLTDASVDTDDIAATPRKNLTTVAMDFGRLSLGSELVLYLFGTPGQDRFWFMWDDIVRGAAGAMVLVDTQRLSDSFAALDYFEERAMPYVVALNVFDGRLTHHIDDVREALHIKPAVPIITCDARSRVSSRHALIVLATHAISTIEHSRRRARPDLRV